MKKTIKTISMGGHDFTIETGQIARQADGSVIVRQGDSTVLCTAVAARKEKSGQSFFPLTVNYQEKFYAAGRIPGGFFKREARPTEKETLLSRLIDRPIRPLFPEGFRNEVQVVCTVLSSDKNHDTDVAAMIGASAALALSGCPFMGPIAGARVGYTQEDKYIICPSREQLENSLLDMVVAGTKDAVLMVESEASELSEEIMLGAVVEAHKAMQPVIQAISELCDELSVEKWVWQSPEKNMSLQQSISDQFKESIEKSYAITAKQERQEAIDILLQKAQEEHITEEVTQECVYKVFHALEKSVVRQNILQGKNRIDGRNLTTVRPIQVETDLLPRAHGSALFTRGETQALVVATLAGHKNSQIIDDIQGEYRDPFMLHYNFPSYSVGETGRMMGPGRREIGHGRLARRGVSAVLPDFSTYPYCIRVVSEITESNGSSSMASVCGTSLALMAAGVPIKRPVAGIAMGLVKEVESYAVLTDILGDEDHLGDMDFKVAGTSEGITALQMDIKIEGITPEIMKTALAQAQDARLHILGEMAKVISESRTVMPDSIPRFSELQINTDKIRDLIGKGGATIKGIIESTGAEIDVDDQGLVKIYAENADILEQAIVQVKEVTCDPEVGKIYTGTVVSIVDFGAFVEILPKQQGLLHISQIAQERVEKVSDYLSENQEIKVKVLEVDRGRIKLSMKEVDS